MSQSQKLKGRDPPPSLFLHPSPAASHVSLPGISHPGFPASNVSGQAGPMQPPGDHRSVSLKGSVAAQIPARPTRNLRTADSSRSADRTDALWAEMQATLEEVELSASGRTHVFGPDHDSKLAELRAAQIALAQAWARSEGDETIETHHGNVTSTGDEVRNLKAAGLGDTGMVVGDTTEAAKAAAGTGSAHHPDSKGNERLGAKLEEETELDILLARKRREANDRYFQRVNQGVLDVVAKLGDVAVAMKAVEQESKDIWGENDSAPESAK